MPALVNMAGKRFGLLLVVSLSPRRSGGHRMWVCNCECGESSTVDGNNLRQGKQVSCGCHRDKMTLARSLKHGEAASGRRTTEYQTWWAIKMRCYDPKHVSYPWYGERGIKVCDRWKESFENFLTDMGRKPDPALTIERIDGNKDYGPDNCKWATRSEQAFNRAPRMAA